MSTSVRTILLPCLLLTGLVLAGCQPKAASGQAVLRIASQKGGTKSLLLASHALDGAPYRVEWSEFPSAQALLEALGAGAVDAGAVGDAPFIFAYAAGDKIKAVEATRAAGGGGGTAVLVRAYSPIQSPADRGSIGHYLLLRVLGRAGLTPKDVTLVFLNPGDARAAFTSGAVDAWVTWGSYVGLARLHDHARIVADGQGLLSGIAFEAANDAAIAGKHAELDDFLRRLAQAERWEATHKPEYAAVLARETGLPPDVALYTVSQARGVPIPIDASVTEEERATLHEYLQAGVIPQAPQIEGAFDASFNDAVKP